MPNQRTDISDKSWDDLAENTDYSVLRELAKERDGVNGNGSTIEIAAGLLISEDRAEEVPEDYRHHYPDVFDDAPEPEADADAEPEPEADEDNDEADEETTPTRASVSPDVDETFIVDGSRLETWFAYIDTLVDEAKLNLSPDGLHVCAVDPANVGMVDTDLAFTAFDSFDVPVEGTIGLNTKRIRNVLSGAGDEPVSFGYRHETRTVVVTYGGHEFTLALIDPDSIRREPDLPDLDLPVEFEIGIGQFKQAIKYVDQVTDHLELRAVEPGDDVARIEIIGKGDTDTYLGTFEDGDGVEILRYPSQATASLFSLDYLKDMTKVWSKTDDRTLRVQMGEEYPVQFDLPLEDDGDEIGHLRFLLAPRIRSE